MIVPIKRSIVFPLRSTTYGGQPRAVHETITPQRFHHRLIDQILHSNRTHEQQLNIMGQLDQQVHQPDPETAIRNMIAIANANNLAWGAPAY